MFNNLAIETRNLKKIFVSKVRGKKQEVEAVKNLDLAVKKSEIFGFLGPNGAGKSTTQRMLSTLLRPTSGGARVLGFNLVKSQQKIRQRIGYISQAGGTDLYATGFENLVLQARLYGADRLTAEKDAKEFVERFQMNSFIARKAASYSGGQRRRLDVALGMVHHPQLLLLDEPTTGLDPQSRAYLWDEIRKLKAEGITVFLSTHYMDEADKLCDRIAIIDNGTIVVEGTPKELKNEIGADTIMFGFSTEDIARRAEAIFVEKDHPQEIKTIGNSVYLYLKDGEKMLPTLMRWLDADKLDPITTSVSNPSLDDVFLKHTGRSLREDNL